MFGGSEACRAEFEKGDKRASAPRSRLREESERPEGQQSDEIERQQKNPDGSPRAKDESLLRF
jgi:hypothetical protein